jgi:hypothetical protein
MHFCLPPATVTAGKRLQQRRHPVRQKCFGGERGGKIDSPLSSKASGAGGGRRTRTGKARMARTQRLWCRAMAARGARGRRAAGARAHRGGRDRRAPPPSGARSRATSRRSIWGRADPGGARWRRRGRGEEAVRRQRGRGAEAAAQEVQKKCDTEYAMAVGAGAMRSRCGEDDVQNTIHVRQTSICLSKMHIVVGLSLMHRIFSSVCFRNKMILRCDN